MVAAEQDEVGQGGGSAIRPVMDVVGVGPPVGSGAAGEGAPAVADVQGAADAGGDGAGGPADVQGFAGRSQDDGDEGRVTRQAAGGGRGQGVAGLGGGAPHPALAELGLQGVQGGGDDQLHADAAADAGVGVGSQGDEVGERVPAAHLGGAGVLDAGAGGLVDLESGSGVGVDEGAQGGGGDRVGAPPEPVGDPVVLRPHPEHRFVLGVAFVGKHPVGVHHVAKGDAQAVDVGGGEHRALAQQPRLRSGMGVRLLGPASGRRGTGHGGQGADQRGDDLGVRA